MVIGWQIKKRGHCCLQKLLKLDDVDNFWSENIKNSPGSLGVTWVVKMGALNVQPIGVPLPASPSQVQRGLKSHFEPNFISSNFFILPNCKVWSVQKCQFYAKFQCDSKFLDLTNQSRCWTLRTKLGIDQSVKISVQNVKSFKMLKFQCKDSNRTKWCNLSEKVWIDQNVEIWGQNWESINMLIFESKLFKFDRKSIKQSECWNLRTNLGIDQSIEISVQNKKSWILKLGCKISNWLR